MARALGHEDEEHSRIDEDGDLSLLQCTANSLAGSRDVLGKSRGCRRGLSLSDTSHSEARTVKMEDGRV